MLHQYLGSRSSHRPSSSTRAENGLDEGSGVDDTNASGGGDADSSKGNHAYTEVMMIPTSTSLSRSGNKSNRCSYCVVEEYSGGSNPTYEAATSKCSVCKQAGCQGHSNRTRCLSFGNTNRRSLQTMFAFTNHNTRSLFCHFCMAKVESNNVLLSLPCLSIPAVLFKMARQGHRIFTIKHANVLTRLWSPPYCAQATSEYSSSYFVIFVNVNVECITIG